ncbi:hypothetical protein [Argonema antarcticum]|uniref:hypothetical protein n=1 Tax=Argonema antarcticum TaxID=2942763 RepID=UPI0020134D2A|nr:hypothetical protein [Argonema antarcticum]MCL1472956.1 hypothetical protein [Argonema antarcticum A004/B2]
MTKHPKLIQKLNQLQQTTQQERLPIIARPSEMLRPSSVHRLVYLVTVRRPLFDKNEHLC